MKHKSITFRCSEAQHRRIQQALAFSSEKRTTLIVAALQDFLDFAETEEVRELDLFRLVERVDAEGNGCRFCDQA